MSVIISVTYTTERPPVPDTQFFSLSLSLPHLYTLHSALHTTSRRSRVSWMSFLKKQLFWSWKLSYIYRLGYFSHLHMYSSYIWLPRKKNNKKLLCFFFVSPFNILISFNIQHSFYSVEFCGEYFLSFRNFINFFPFAN